MQESIDARQYIALICDRAEKELGFKKSERLSHFMDLDLAIEKLGLDVNRLQLAKNSDFAHDILGIQFNINRQNKTFDKHWTPRHTLP